MPHYGVVALPCRVGDPDRKGKVESGVGHAQKTPLQGMRFETIEEAQAYLDRWETRWADTRIHGTTKRQVAAMFAEEQPALAALPLEPFRYYRFGVRTVHLDGCVEVDAAYYGALAFSPATHATGDSYNYSSQTAAENAAVQYCGHADCYAVAWFENSCGAIAVAPTGQVGCGTASSGEAAEALALANCEIAH